MANYFDPDEEDFQNRWWNRLGPLAPKLGGQALLEQQEREQDIRPPGKDYFDPRFAGGPPSPKLQQGIEEERGMTYPELDLQAKFQRSRGLEGLYPGYKPAGPTEFNLRDLKMYPLDPGAGKGLPTDTSPGGLRQWAVEDEYMNPPRHLYNTPLDSAHDANNYLAWAKKGGKNAADEEEDYDLRGYYKAGGKLGGPGVHLPDQFKKPSHPTFSEESRYSGPGQEGGKWVQDKKGNYVAFRVGPANLAHRKPEQIQSYFDAYEPGVKLIFPLGTEGVPTAAAGPSEEEKRRALMMEYNKRLEERRKKK